jgi:hypothetical protein
VRGLVTSDSSRRRVWRLRFLPMAYPVDLGNVDTRDSFSDLGQSFTSRTADDWADCANSEDWGSPPSPCGGTLQDEEKTAGPEGLVADGMPQLAARSFLRPVITNGALHRRHRRRVPAAT